MPRRRLNFGISNTLDPTRGAQRALGNVGDIMKMAQEARMDDAKLAQYKLENERNDRLDKMKVDQFNRPYEEQIKQNNAISEALNSVERNSAWKDTGDQITAGYKATYDPIYEKLIAGRDMNEEQAKAAEIQAGNQAYDAYWGTGTKTGIGSDPFNKRIDDMTVAINAQQNVVDDRDKYALDLTNAMANRGVNNASGQVASIMSTIPQPKVGKTDYKQYDSAVKMVEDKAKTETDKVNKLYDHLISGGGKSGSSSGKNSFWTRNKTGLQNMQSKIVNREWSLSDIGAGELPILWNKLTVKGVEVPDKTSKTGKKTLYFSPEQAEYILKASVEGSDSWFDKAAEISGEKLTEVMKDVENNLIYQSLNKVDKSQRKYALESGEYRKQIDAINKAKDLAAAKLYNNQFSGGKKKLRGSDLAMSEYSKLRNTINGTTDESNSNTETAKQKNNKSKAEKAKKAAEQKRIADAAKEAAEKKRKQDRYGSKNIETSVYSKHLLKLEDQLSSANKSGNDIFISKTKDLIKKEKNKIKNDANNKDAKNAMSNGFKNKTLDELMTMHEKSDMDNNYKLSSAIMKAIRKKRKQ